MSKIRNKLQNLFNNSDFNHIILNESYVPLNETDKQNIIYEPELSIDKNILSIIELFMDFIKQNLDLEVLPKINLLFNRKEGMTYGCFNPNNNEIDVFAKNRGLADIIRTIAHELVHHWQNINNKIPPNMSERNLELESEANTKAGDIVYMFGLQQPEIYNITIIPKEIK